MNWYYIFYLDTPFQIYFFSGLVGIDVGCDVVCISDSSSPPSLSSAVSSCVSPSLHLWSGGL